MNLRWSPPPGSVEAADAEPWNGPLAHAMRPMSYRNVLRAVIAAVLEYGIGGTAALLTVIDPAPGENRGGMVAISVTAFAISLGTLVLLVVASPSFIRRVTPVAAVTTLYGSILVISLAILAVGPNGQALAILYCEAPVFAFYMFRRSWAIAIVVLAAFGYGAVLLSQQLGAPAWAYWYVVVSTVALTGVLVGEIAKRAEQLSESEHAARAELADLNATLEQRVDAQVEELERLGRMRRFLSPQIADAVLSGGSEEILQPHRRRIAVFFCDLRGFTAFTNSAEPEEVVQVLDEYYQAVGAVLQQHHATIGGYAGDGIMAYFGDPVPTQRPARDAVTMAIELTSVLDVHVSSWRRRGHELGYGMGIGYGYATLGVVGFDSRCDYTPLGAVVNLAARLCAKAAPGELLVDLATSAETDDDVSYVERPSVEIKGFTTDTRVFAWNRPGNVLRMPSVTA